jgi:hypothetical protein
VPLVVWRSGLSRSVSSLVCVVTSHITLRRKSSCFARMYVAAHVMQQVCLSVGSHLPRCASDYFARKRSGVRRGHLSGSNQQSSLTSPRVRASYAYRIVGDCGEHPALLLGTLEIVGCSCERGTAGFERRQVVNYTTVLYLTNTHVGVYVNNMIDAVYIIYIIRCR